jgi:hypothetical protein
MISKKNESRFKKWRSNIEMNLKKFEKRISKPSPILRSDLSTTRNSMRKKNKRSLRIRILLLNKIRKSLQTSTR